MGAFPNLPVPGYLSNNSVRYCWLNSAPPEHNVRPFLGTARQDETWTRFKRTERQMAWDVS